MNEEIIVKNYKYFISSIIIKFGEEDESEQLGSYISQKYNQMTNNNESYYTDQFFNNHFKCNRKNSFSNFYQPYDEPCDRHYFDNITRSLKSDGSSKDFMNIAYGLLLSYNSYLNTNCTSYKNTNKSSSLVDCLKIARDATIIRPYLQNIVLPIDFRNYPNLKLFKSSIEQNVTSPNCDGFTVKYTIDIAIELNGNISYEK